MATTLAGVTIHAPRDGDEQRLLELIQLAFGDWPTFELAVTPIEHLRRKMSSPHPLAMQHHRVVEIGSEVVDASVRIPRVVKIEGKIRLAKDGGDSVVRPRFQQRGIYNAMSDYSHKHHDSEYDLSIGYSLSPAVLRVRSRGTNRSPANHIQVLVKPLDVRRLVRGDLERHGGRARALLMTLAIRALGLLGRLRHRPFRRPQPVTWSLATVEQFDDRIDDFFEQASAAFDFIVVRTPEYLNWRYCDIRGGRFTCG